MIRSTVSTVASNTTKCNGRIKRATNRNDKGGCRFDHLSTLSTRVPKQQRFGATNVWLSPGLPSLVPKRQRFCVDASRYSTKTKLLCQISSDLGNESMPPQLLPKHNCQIVPDIQELPPMGWHGFLKRGKRLCSIYETRVGRRGAHN